MGSNQKDERVDEAIQRILAEIEKIEKMEPSGDCPLHGDNNQRQFLYSTLHSELEHLKSLKSDGMLTQSKVLLKHQEEEELIVSEQPKVLSKHHEEGEISINHEVSEKGSAKKVKPVNEDMGGPCRSNGTVGAEEEIVKELRFLKRQNLVTHRLLSAMIVLIIAWQLSEVSLVLKVKDGLTNPFRSIGSVLSRFLKGSTSASPLEEEKQKSSLKQQPLMDIVTSLPPLNMPELPHMDLGVNGGKDSDH